VRTRAEAAWVAVARAATAGIAAVGMAVAAAAMARERAMTANPP